jgi:hypothetical protein
MSLQPGCLTRFWLWACVGVLTMFGSFSFGGGAYVWALDAAFIGLLAARTVSGRRAAAAIAVGIATPLLVVLSGSPWPLAAGPVAALALALVHTRREAIVLSTALGLVVVAGVALRYADDGLLALVIAPVFVILVALATGRPQREAAGAITGAGLALFAVGYPLPGVSLTLAGATLMLTLGLRRRRMAAAVSA